MIRPTGPAATVSTAPIVKSTQFGLGISAMPPTVMVMTPALLDDDGFGFGLGRCGHGHNEANGGKGG